MEEDISKMADKQPVGSSAGGAGVAEDDQEINEVTGEEVINIEEEELQS